MRKTFCLRVNCSHVTGCIRIAPRCLYRARIGTMPIRRNDCSRRRTNAHTPSQGGVWRTPAGLWPRSSAWLERVEHAANVVVDALHDRSTTNPGGDTDQAPN